MDHFWYNQVLFTKMQRKLNIIGTKLRLFHWIVCSRSTSLSRFLSLALPPPPLLSCLSLFLCLFFLFLSNFAGVMLPACLSFCYPSYFCLLHTVGNVVAAISMLTSVFVDYAQLIPWSLLLTSNKLSASYSSLLFLKLLL